MNNIKSIAKGLKLSKSLFVSSIIMGEPYTGKMELVRSIYPQSIYIDANDEEELINALQIHDEIIIYNFEVISKLDKYDFQNKRIIAIANKTISNDIQKNFAFIYNLPPLSQREEEVKKVAEKLAKQIGNDLMMKEPIVVNFKELDLSQNFKSLKVSLYKQILKRSLTLDDIEEILFNKFFEKLDGKNGYKEYIGIYERPLIKAGLKKYKSQLKLSDVLGLNRNTLRKKINEHRIN